jgi:adenine-specific DNA-methyltransferase
LSTLSDLLRQVEQQDVQLAADLRQEVKALESRCAFGLNFERHLPETVELPGRAVRKGDKVRFLPERGEPENSVDRSLWLVKSIRRAGNSRVADLIQRSRYNQEPRTASRAVDDLVVVAEFRDSIFPGLVSTGKVERGGKKPYHSVINAENFHALQSLLYTHEGKVDAIYIDPPYNTGARDWKYNNNYVESEDAYRHSKWLAFMERRLKLAKRLLNSENSVLIVTIDEKEYLRLGLLLDQVFIGERIQMVTTAINATGTIRSNEFTRVNEYIFFVLIGKAQISPEQVSEADSEVPWNLLQRREMPSRRGGPKPGPDQFYPIYVDREKRRFEKLANHYHVVFLVQMYPIYLAVSQYFL